MGKIEYDLFDNIIFKIGLFLLSIIGLYFLIQLALSVDNKIVDTISVIVITISLLLWFTCIAFIIPKNIDFVNKHIRNEKYKKNFLIILNYVREGLYVNVITVLVITFLFLIFYHMINLTIFYNIFAIACLWSGIVNLVELKKLIPVLKKEIMKERNLSDWNGMD